MASLPILPVEILDLITQHLMSPSLQGFQDNGICSLRLTCRALCLKTQYAFANAAFCTLRIGLHPKTLQRWLQVCGVPAFAGAVKKIVFAHWGDEYISFPEVEKEDLEETGKKEGARLGRQVSFVLRRIFNVAFAGLKDVEVLIIVPFAARFRRFHCYPPASDLLHPSEVDQDAKGYNRLHVENFCVTASALFSFIANAIPLAPCRLTSLSTTRSGWPNQDNPHLAAPVFAIHDHTLATCVPALGRLRHVSLSVHDTGYFAENGSWSDTLNSMPELVSLQLQFIAPGGNYWENGPRFAVGRSLEEVRLPLLAQLSLRHVEVDEDVLKRFLGIHAKTLRRLELVSIELPSPGRWRPVLQLLLNHAVLLEDIRFWALGQSSAMFWPEALETGRGCIHHYKTRQGVVDGLTWFLNDMM
jgi:hypothetical protein